MTTEMENYTEEWQSSYLQYLPALYREHDFVGRFLCIFEDILQPIEGIIDKMSLYLDAGTAPESFLPWLASWIGMALDDRWPVEKQRALIKSAAELYRWRGTRRGLSQYLEIYTGRAPEIIEPDSTAIETSENGEDKTTFSQSRSASMKQHCFTVVLTLDKVTDIDMDIVRNIIEIQKPAHTAYLLKTKKQSNNMY